MIYVPILKTRKEELNIAKDMCSCFSACIIPMFEVIRELYKNSYKVDSSGEFVYEKRKKRWVKVKKDPTAEDIVTLQRINNIVDGRMVFIDYFRFSLRKYGRNISIGKAGLSFDLNNDLNLYKNKLLESAKYANIIPVISLKPDCGFPKSDLLDFISKIQQKTNHIALRITEEYLDYSKEAIHNMRETDFLLFDVEEQNPELKFMEIQELIDLRVHCRLILLNSPRKSAIRNSEYPEHAKTDLINNCARVVAEG